VGVRGGRGKADRAKHLEVRFVVSDISDLAVRQAKLLLDRRVGFELILDRLPDSVEAELLGPAQDDGRRSPGEQADPTALLPQGDDSVPVPDVKRLRLPAVVTVGDAAVGQDTVNIEEEERDRLQGGAI